MYLVTGGAGFIGSNIVEALVRSGEAVRVLDDLSNGLAANLAPFEGKIDFRQGDIRDRAAVERAVEGVSVVLHLAALGSVQRSVEDPATTDEVNVGGTLKVLVAARAAGVGRVVFSSSSSVYGDNPALPKSEDLPTWPISPYAVSKQAGESYTRAFARVYGMDTVCLRYFNVFGPRQRPDAAYAAVIPLFIGNAYADRPLVIFGDGNQSRDFTYVENVVRANLAAAGATGVAGRVFNIACGERYSLLDIVTHLEAVSGKVLRCEYREARVGDVRHSQADIKAAREALGFEVSVDFREGLRRTWDAFLTRQALRVRT